LTFFISPLWHTFRKAAISSILLGNISAVSRLSIILCITFCASDEIIFPELHCVSANLNLVNAIFLATGSNIVGCQLV